MRSRPSRVVRGVDLESARVSASRPVINAGQVLEHTTTESHSVHIAISGLSSHQLSAKHVDLSINGCHRVRRPLQHLMLSDLLPLGSQRARTGISLRSHNPIDFPEDQTEKKKMWRTRRTETETDVKVVVSDEKCLEQQAG